jgi:hypothetical protein
VNILKIFSKFNLNIIISNWFTKKMKTSITKKGNFTIHLDKNKSISSTKKLNKDLNITTASKIYLYIERIINI